jgi:hypothetical protein
LISEVTRAIRGRQTINPRTVLGFYATVIGLLLAATVGGVAVLATTGHALHLIPWLLGFAGAAVVVLLIGVFIITLVDPSKLMLGQVTGSEYVAIQRTVLGDALTGEHVELVGSVDEAIVTAEPSAPSGPRRLRYLTSTKSSMLSAWTYLAFGVSHTANQ